MGRFFALLLAIIAGIGGSQAPGFTLQYMQNLNGRVDELRPIVRQFDAEVGRFGYDRARALDECSNADGLLEALCSGYSTTIRRFVELSAHLDLLRSTKPLMKPIVLAQNFKKDIVESTRKEFEPAIPATLDGAVYGGGAFVIVWLVFSLLFGGIGSLFGGGRRSRGQFDF